MARTNKTKFAILGLVALRPMSGYDIKRHLDATVGHFWTENFGHLYPVLHRLTKQKLLEVEHSESEGGRPRHAYRITAAGREHLDAWLREAPEPFSPRNELLLQLFFGKELGPRFLGEKLEAERQRQEALLARLTALEERIRSEASPAEAASWLLTLSYGQAMARALIGWCERAGAELRTSPSPKPRRGRASR
jgi:DNA-binding PadR family transcriptional regulator